MLKRLLLTLTVMVAIIAGLGFVKFKQIQTAIAQGAAYRPPPEAVTTVVAARDEWPSSLSAIGTVEAVQGVTVSADLPGTVVRIAFDSGTAVREGDVLAELDTRQEKAQLAAAEAARDLARVDLKRADDLLKDRVVSQAEYDRAAETARSAEARVDEIRATIARKTIRAPFAGILGIRQANVGQYLSPGDPIVSLQSLHPIHVNFSVPQQAAAKIRRGGAVSISGEAVGGEAFDGRVTALDSVVDAGTRNVQIQATLANPGGRLRPGMFVDVSVAVGSSRSVIALPASAISYAPYGDSVFVVTDMKDPDGAPYRGVRQQFVKVEGARGDQVAVVSGLKPGEEVVTSGLFKLRNGTAVLVNNKDAKPSNNPAAKPENS
jgi:membrane fusion protein (multidrug efflux system)